MNENCAYNDHTWAGTSKCIECGTRLRCDCGVYVREDRIDTHMATTCKFTAKLERCCPICGAEDTPMGCGSHFI